MMRVRLFGLEEQRERPQPTNETNELHRKKGFHDQLIHSTDKETDQQTIRLSITFASRIKLAEGESITIETMYGRMHGLGRSLEAS